MKNGLSKLQSVESMGSAEHLLMITSKTSTSTVYSSRDLMTKNEISTTPKNSLISIGLTEQLQFMTQVRNGGTLE